MGAIGVAVIAAAVHAPWVRDQVQRIELMTYDMRMSLAPPAPESPAILHVDIDDSSIDREGRWPWPRDRHALLLDALEDLGVESVLFDILFTEDAEPVVDDARGDVRIVDHDETLARALDGPAHTTLAYHSFPAAQAGDMRTVYLRIRDVLTARPADGDPAGLVLEADTVAERAGLTAAERNVLDNAEVSLRERAAFDLCMEALADDPQVGADDLLERLGIDPNLQEALLLRGAHAQARGVRVVLADWSTDAEGVLVPGVDPFDAWETVPAIPVLAEACDSHGFVSIMTDPLDGVLRRVPLLIRRDDRILWQMAFTEAVRRFGLRLEDVVVEPGLLTLPGATLADGTVTDVRIPMDERCRVLVHWPGSRAPSYTETFEHLPAGALIAYGRARRTLRENVLRVAAFWSLPECAAVRAQLAAEGGDLQAHAATVEAALADAPAGERFPPEVARAASDVLLADPEATFRLAERTSRAVPHLFARLVASERPMLQVGRYAVGAWSEEDPEAAEAAAEMLEGMAGLEADDVAGATALVEGREDLFNALLERMSAVIREQLVDSLGPDGVHASVGDVPRALQDMVQYRDHLAVLDRMARALADVPRDHAVLTERIADYRERMEPVVAGSIALIGSNHTGSVDLKPTPLNPNYPGVGLHSGILNAVLTRTFLREAPAPVHLLVLLAAGLAAAAIVARFGPFVSAGLVALLAVAIAGLSLLAFTQGVWVHVAAPLAAVVGAYATVTAYRQVAEERGKRQVRAAMGTYLSPDVMEEVLADPERLRLGGERREVTLFFSDLVGFTTLSESMGSEELVHLMNRYLGVMTGEILEERGTLDKYIGDAIMAIFGAPISMEDHAVRGCEAAVRNWEALQVLREEFRAEGLPDIDVRIGLNTGEVVVGNMGSEKRMEYTALGDAVNLASRLEGANKDYGTHMMVGTRTRELAEHAFEFRRLDRIRVKGKEEAVEVHELMARKGELSDERADARERYEAAFALHLERRFEEAAAEFERLVAAGDPPSTELLQRCRIYLEEAPDESWDGAWTRTTK